MKSNLAAISRHTWASSLLRGVGSLSFSLAGTFGAKPTSRCGVQANLGSSALAGTMCLDLGPFMNFNVLCGPAQAKNGAFKVKGRVYAVQVYG